jgi:hypothetical protein
VPAGGIAATDVQAAINELDTEKYTPDDNTLALSRLVNASAQYVLMGRTSAGAGAWQEKAASADVFTMLGSADNAAIRSNIGADTAYVNISGDTMSGELIITLSGAGTAALRTNSDSGFSGGIFARAGDNASPPTSIMTKSRGTIGSPTAIAQNDEIFRFDANGYDGATSRGAYRHSAVVVAATPSATNMESQQRTLLCPASSVTLTEIERWAHASGLSMFGANVVIDQNRMHRLRVYTVATLPAGVTGNTAYVSDALGPAFGAAVVGGGAVDVPVYYDGGAAAWTVG